MASDETPPDVGAAGSQLTIELDERGTRCPQPIIALGKAALGKAAHATSGEVRIVLLADDPAAIVDVPAWCRMTSARLLNISDLPDGSGTRFEVLVTPGA